MRRSIGTTAAIAALALTATACGSDGDDAGSGGDGKVTVTYWDTSNETEAKVFRAVAEEFAEGRDDVEVDYVNIGWDGAQDRFKNAAPTGEAPHVMRTEVAWVSDFASLDYLAPLDGTPAVENQDDYLEQAWASTQYDGTTYAVPQVIDTLALFYNEQLLDEAGVDVPESLTDIQDSVDAFEGLEAPFYLRGDDAYWFLPYLYGEGGDLVDADSETVTVDDAAGVAAFQAVQDLLDSGAAITDTTDGWESMMSSFGNGDVAMMINGPWAINDARDAIGAENLGVAPVPAGSAGQGSPQGGWNYGVYAGLGEADMTAAQEFVAYMSSADVQQRITEELSLLPTRSSVYEAESVAANEMVEFFAPAVEVAHERAWIPQANSLFDPLKEEAEAMLLGRATPEETTAAIADRYRELLDWQ
ncbi:extracellular solute-binding protein [Streptomyces spiramenti]|uniref:Extracellular solute-binding protein n=1 Tax=Streptomyces spiramenti TaxID=2720606 RepID=A0ABX1AT12_9ACTN|nr:extracellular solute-binding protein [Streptomyces spiramenti]NJP68736.1 extracellular solute-binding protein [Streptomyces spiramenti]